MAKTTIVAQVPKQLAVLPLVALAADIALVASSGTGANGNQTLYTDTEILIAHNTHATLPYTVTIESAPDASGREGDLTAYEVAAGAIAVFDPRSMARGDWQQPDGMLYFEASNAAVKFAVLRVGR